MLVNDLNIVTTFCYSLTNIVTKTSKLLKFYSIFSRLLLF